jgi:hypothetical protein
VTGAAEPASLPEPAPSVAGTGCGPVACVFVVVADGVVVTGGVGAATAGVGTTTVGTC